MDLAYEFEKKSREIAHELFEEALSIIKSGKGAVLEEKLHDLSYEFTDRLVPIPTVELWKHVEFLDERWDEVDRSGTFDQALRQAVFHQASEHVFDEFEKFGSEPKLEALKAAYDAAALAMMHEKPEAEYAKAAARFQEQFATLGWAQTWPPTEPTLLKILADNQDEPAPQEKLLLNLNIAPRSRGPR